LYIFLSIQAVDTSRMLGGLDFQETQKAIQHSISVGGPRPWTALCHPIGNKQDWISIPISGPYPHQQKSPWNINAQGSPGNKWPDYWGEEGEIAHRCCPLVNHKQASAIYSSASKAKKGITHKKTRGLELSEW